MDCLKISNNSLYRYELANLLGNILNVVTDRKLPVADANDNTKVTYFTADVVSYSDYLPFGQVMPNRHGDDNQYRYGFNGMEKIDELHNNSGDSYDFGARIYDPRIGRWLSRDAYEAHCPDKSTYSFGACNPIVYVDKGGDYFYATTTETQFLTMSAIRMVFGDDVVNDFSFNDEGRLIYTGNGKLDDCKKEYLLTELNNNIVNNTNNNVYLKQEGIVEGNSDRDLFLSDDSQKRQEAENNGMQALSIEGESTVSIKLPSGNYVTTIFIGSSTEIGEGTPTITRNPLELFWHGIGHSLTNFRLNVHAKEARGSNPNYSNAQKQTVGFENFIEGLVGGRQRDGSNHGSENILSSRGIDNYYQDKANDYKDFQENKKSRNHRGSGLGSLYLDDFEKNKLD